MSAGTGRVIVTPSGGGGLIGAKITADGNQDLNSAAKILLTVTTYDTDGFVTGNSRLTIPSGQAGVYLVQQLVYRNGESITMGLASSVLKNGAYAPSVPGGIAEGHNNVDQYWPGDIVATGSEPVLLVVGDFLELYAFANGAVAQPIGTTTFLAITKLF